MWSGGSKVIGYFNAVEIVFNFSLYSDYNNVQCRVAFTL